MAMPPMAPRFPRWYRSTGHRGYGVTEFHPLKAMDAPAMQRILAQHAARGAEFLSFFLEPRWHGQLVARGSNMFSFDPEKTNASALTICTPASRIF